MLPLVGLVIGIIAIAGGQFAMIVIGFKAKPKLGLPVGHGAGRALLGANCRVDVRHQESQARGDTVRNLVCGLFDRMAFLRANDARRSLGFSGRGTTPSPVSLSCFLAAIYVYALNFPSRFRFRVKPDLPPGGWRRAHQLPKGIEDSLELAVVFLLHFIDFAGQFGVAVEHFAMRTKARTTRMLAWIAVGLLSTLAAITAPYSVNTKGSFRRPPRPVFDVAFCNIKDATSCCARG